MAIGGINNNIDFDFGSVSRKNIALDDAKRQELLQNQSAATKVDPSTVEPAKEEASEPRSKVVSPKPEVEFEFNLKRGRDLNLIGAKSEKDDIDVSKAVSDIQKDSILSQYKFFVKTGQVNNEDGTVRRVNR